MPRPITDKTQLVPAAQYLRMSTEHQQYSFANQRTAIGEFAARNGYVVVRSYEDAGKSGLAIRHREGLQKLLHDVVSGSADFKVVLVYDVSRWGRFLDSDEAAHYEFLCKNSGVPVHYCAEQFTNDGSVPSAILKTLRRTMAGEYVCDLSTKVFTAQKRLAADGFRVGGTAGYGLRRMAVSPDGKARRRLAAGQRKPFATDHVTLVPGPKKEVAVVRRICRMFVRARGEIGPFDIARTLNRDCIPAAGGRPWTPFAVRQVLTHPKYVGALVWGRTTQKLRTKPRRQHKNEWVINEHAHEPLVARRDSEQAQAVFKKRSERVTPERDLIRNLRRILAKHGELKQTLINRKTGSFALSTYQRRFGSMQRLYDLLNLQYPAGMFPGRSKGEATIHTRNSLVQRILDLFPEDLTSFRVSHSAHRLNLLLDEKFRVFVWVANYYQSQAGTTGWKLQPASNESGGMILLCLMRPDNQDYARLYLFPGLAMQCTEYAFGSEDPLLKQGVPLPDISQLCSTAREMISDNSPLRIKAEIVAPRASGHPKEAPCGTRRTRFLRIVSTEMTPIE